MTQYIVYEQVAHMPTASKGFRKWFPLVIKVLMKGHLILNITNVEKRSIVIFSCHLVDLSL